MTTFDDSIAAAVAEYRAREQEKAAALGALGLAQTDINEKAAYIAALQAELEECRNPTPPVAKVPLGPYSGTLTELKARETLLGVSGLGSWQFLFMNKGLAPGWDGREFLIPNIHARMTDTHIKWKAITTSTQYDAPLIATIKTLASAGATPLYLSPQEEMDGAEAAQFHSDEHDMTPGSVGEGRRIEEYRAFLLKIKGFVNTYAPGVPVWQVLADVSRFPRWIVHEADGYAFDPHFYGWVDGKPTGGTFRERLDTIHATLQSLGVTKPYGINVGGVENPADPQGKPTYIREMGATLATANADYAHPPQLATWWDRSGTVQGKLADERIDSSPASLAAFKEVFA